MSQVDLLWAAVSLLLLGAAVSMCMKCQGEGNKQEKKGLDVQRNPGEDQHIFEAVRSYSISGHEQLKAQLNFPRKSKSSKHKSIPSHDESQPDQDAAYIEPICADYYNCGKSFQPASDDGSRTYQNVTGLLNGTRRNFAETGIYENSAAVHSWQTPSRPGSSSTDDEPDYVNAGPSSAPN